jgi:hypothetical protein
MFTCRILAIALVSVHLAAAPVLCAADRTTLEIGGVNYYLSGNHGYLEASDDTIVTFEADLRVTGILITPEGEPAGHTFLVGTHVHSEIVSATHSGRLKFSMEGSFAATLADIEAELIAGLPSDQWTIERIEWSLERSVLVIEQPAGAVVSIDEFDRIRQR